MNAAFEALLALQARDTVIDQLSYQRDALAPRATLNELMKKAAALHGAVVKAQQEHDAAAKAVADAELEVDKLEKRIKEINARLYGSAPISPKDAQAMTEEVKHIEVLKSNHETDVLEKMDLLEPRVEEMSRLTVAGKTLASEIETAKAGVLAGEAELDAKLVAEREARAESEKAVPYELLTRYDALRPRLGGVAIAIVEGGKCGGCHLSMSAMAVEALRRADESAVVTCEECGRLLAH